MANMIDYIDWRGDLSFSESAFNEVDNLILSSIAYVDFEDIVSPSLSEPKLLRLAAREYLLRHRGEKVYLGAMVSPKLIALMAKAAKSRRFGCIRVCGYINHISDKDQTQFSAITYILNDKHVFVAYRGTDDTIVGWKENFNMSFMHPVPAQTAALSYFERVAAERKEGIYTGGHSKGGNLAVYALAKCSDETKERVACAFNNDGPGFTKEFMDSVEYESIREKIRTLLPQSSVIGMLLEHEENYEVVKSSYTGIMQHQPISWEVLGNSFIHLDTVTDNSKYVDKTIKEWLAAMSDEEREAFVENLFAALTSTNAKTLTDFNSDRKKILQAWNGLDVESRNTVFKYVKLLFREKTKNVIPQKKAPVPKKTLMTAKRTIHNQSTTKRK